VIDGGVGRVELDRLIEILNRTIEIKPLGIGDAAIEVGRGIIGLSLIASSKSAMARS
jgi:hypothetical protein